MKNFTTADIKKFGKVTKIASGYYQYNGKNFTLDIEKETYDTTYWSLQYTGDNEKLLEDIYGWNQYETKKEAVWAARCMDFKIENNML